MAYREPGVYTELINNRPNTGFTPNLVPLIIGEGPAYLDYVEVPITRAGVADPSTSATTLSAQVAIYTDSAYSGSISSTATGTYKYAACWLGEDKLGVETHTMPAPPSDITLVSGTTAIDFMLAGDLPTNATGARVFLGVVGTATTTYYSVGDITPASPTLTVTSAPTTAAISLYTTASAIDYVDTLTVNALTSTTSEVLIYTKTADGIPVPIASTSNFAVTAAGTITWTSSSASIPANGSTYYADFVARPADTQYEITFVTSYAELYDAYVGQFMLDPLGTGAQVINPVCLGAYLALESGATGVYVAQIKPNSATYTVPDAEISTLIDDALTKASFIDDAYFVVPMTSNLVAVNKVITHCLEMSTVEERKERVCFLSKKLDNIDTNSSGILESGELNKAVGRLVSLNDKRVRVPFVTSVTKPLSDGSVAELYGEYVCAALAGLASFVPPYRSLTRQKLYNFLSLVGTKGDVTKLTRTNKNKVAQVGYMLLEQVGGEGAPITIRHGVTTKMDNIADREHSIVILADFVAKYLRATLESYIGVYNIDSFLLSKVTASLNVCKNWLTRNRYLIDLQVGNIQQDADNPDTLLIEVSILPPYPCNYIDITILVE